MHLETLLRALQQLDTGKTIESRIALELTVERYGTGFWLGMMELHVERTDQLQQGVGGDLRGGHAGYCPLLSQREYAHYYGCLAGAADRTLEPWDTTRTGHMSKPEIGQWYQDLDKGELFQVTGVDDKSASVEVQYFGGDLDEVELDSWDELPLALAEPPEDWTGPMDDIEKDDLGYTDFESPPPNRIQPPEPLSVEPWDDTRNGVLVELSNLVGDED
jgi:hypothetical protein